MKLLIVVSRLLTGFDAPTATYIYIDKQMRDHGLFQAICRVNRLDGDDKDFGYIVDYKDLFRNIESAVEDYTSEAFDAFDKEDVEGLITDRAEQAADRISDGPRRVARPHGRVEQPKSRRRDLRLLLEPARHRERPGCRGEGARRQALYKIAGRMPAPTPMSPPSPKGPVSTIWNSPESREVEQRPRHPGRRRLHSGDAVDMKRLRARHAAPDRQLHPGRRFSRSSRISTTSA